MTERWSLRLPFSSGCAAIVVLALWASSVAAQDVDPWAKGSSWGPCGSDTPSPRPKARPTATWASASSTPRSGTRSGRTGASAQIDVLGRYGTASQTEAPFTVETARHFKWSTPTRPYVGAGLGAYYQKIQGTTDDGASFEPGVYLMFGTNTPVSPRGLIGFDVRMSYVGMDRQNNPVFGGEATTGRHQSHSYHWSAKLSYAWVL